MSPTGPNSFILRQIEPGSEAGAPTPMGLCPLSTPQQEILDLPLILRKFTQKQKLPLRFEPVDLI